MSKRTVTTALAATLVLLLALATLWVLLTPTPRTTPGACTHWASPAGTGTTCTETAPCQVASWWPLATPGGVLCLRPGTYTGAAQLLDPPDTLAGTPNAPLTVRAEQDGTVLLDAAHAHIAVHLQPGNDWWVLDGLNATRGKEYVYRLNANHLRGRRLIAWDGTSGQDDAILLSLGRGVDVVVEDCAGWGLNARKIFDGAQSTAPGEASGWSGFRRCWGEWNDHPMGTSQPSNTYQMGYRTRQQRFENVLGTWHTAEDGQVRGAEAIVSFFYDCAQPLDVMGTQLLGSLFYLRPGARFPTGALTNSFCTTNAVWREVVAAVPAGFPTVRPFQFNAQTSAAPQTGNTCTNCLSIHNGTPSLNMAQAGWTLPGFREGASVAEATGGQSVYELLPGLCYRYEQGLLTTEPLWPWPMEQRIAAARAMAGAPPVQVTQEVESLLGPIPPHCRAASTPLPPDPVPPGTGRLRCEGTIAQVPGPVTMECLPQEGRR